MEIKTETTKSVVIVIFFSLPPFATEPPGPSKICGCHVRAALEARGRRIGGLASPGFRVWGLGFRVQV